MSPLLENIAGYLLPHLEGVTALEKWVECSRTYPWYPVSWLMLAETGNPESLEKAALWFNDEQRLLWLLQAAPVSQDKWLSDQLQQINQRKTASIQTIQAKPLEQEKVETFEDQPEKLPGPGETKPEPVEGHKPVVVLEDAPIAEVIPGLKSFPPGNAKAEPLLFEPYHVVDYFASQGIKLSLDDIPRDKLEKQMKSFTQWLKTMKKVNAEPAAYADPVVEAQAVESNTGKEVVTEAMAQVLEKQDKFDKAMAIYEKLILLHPEKGALFAARIEDLKTKQ